MEPIQVAPFGISVEVKGAELIMMYRNRSQLHARRAEELEGHLGALAVQLKESAKARAAAAEAIEAEHVYDPTPQLPATVLHPQGQVAYLRSRIDNEVQTSKVLAFMADHVDEKKTYPIVEQDVERLLGPMLPVGVAARPMIGAGIGGGCF